MRAPPDRDTGPLGNGGIDEQTAKQSPHNWDAGVIFEETTRTLFCGDLFTRIGNGPALTESDIVEPSIAAEDMFQYTSLAPSTAPTIRRLADLKPERLATMHGPSFAGNAADALRDLADRYAARLGAALPG